MSTPEEHLGRWQAAGVIDADTAARVRTYEATRQERGGEDRPGIMEAVVYLGVAIAAVGVAILIGSAWSDLEQWARIAVVGVPAILAIVAGQALRSIGQPGMVRGGHMAWLVATALAAATAAIAADAADWSESNIALSAGVTASAVAVVLWVVAPNAVQVFGVAGGLFVLAMAIGSLPDEYTPFLPGLMAAAFGAALLVMTETGTFHPRWAAQGVSALLLTWGAFFAGFDEPWAESLAFIAAVALVTLSIWRGAFIYMVLGLVLGFGALVRSIAIHVDDPTAASLALILVGALIVASVILLARHKPWRASPLAA